MALMATARELELPASIRPMVAGRTCIRRESEASNSSFLECYADEFLIAPD
jgi:hypothetical protein